MIAGMIKGATRVLGKAQGYFALPVRDELMNSAIGGEDTPCMKTAWFPTPKEIEEINNGAAIYVTIVGTLHPPIMLDVGKAEKI